MEMKYSEIFLFIIILIQILNLFIIRENFANIEPCFNIIQTTSNSSIMERNSVLVKSIEILISRSENMHNDERRQFYRLLGKMIEKEFYIFDNINHFSKKELKNNFK